MSDLTAARPDIALYVPYCELHCMTYQAAGLAVTEQETGQQEGVADFISGWLAGDGRTEHHAVDDITLVNPTCPESFCKCEGSGKGPRRSRPAVMPTAA